MNYTFHLITHCNMCGSEISSHKILGKRLNQSQGKTPKKKIGITTTIVQCSTCNLIYSNPQPRPSNIQDHYGVPPETYWQDSYFQVSPNYFNYEIEELQKIKPFAPGQKALDIGAGLGKGMIVLQKAGYDTYGFEPSKPFYERAINKMGIDNNKLKLSTFEEVDYPEESFDFITFGAVLEHLYDPDFCIKKALRWLKKDGVMHFEIPSANWLISKIVNFYYKLKGLDYVTNLSPMHPPFHLYEFSLNSFKKNGLNNNYEITHFDYDICQTGMPKILDIPLKFYMRKTNMGMQLIVWIKKK